ncbi:hypothetical protein BO79DRAFT_223082 [Aspergillus costaricaensis CBS 115574]|uniref:Uncharacterized protein n=1 Tax=Aspergillus costaricaensis CBS 115574 TaxID=1448317 RepID=A0ACD1HXQ5_9EURO|nr:hypothetical protein BO79DRAFT_223082 [Aspergillus costaricaensis CBS 115574]RAK82830.1 hypothetical protein BO79DRAFT_223082 [Aspergillus costaricaensis CBS 115574]
MPFTWNWVVPANIDSESGIMAINCNTFAEYLKDHLMEMVRPACMSVDKLTVNVLWNGVNPEFYYYCLMVTGYSPQTATVLTDASDSKAIHLEFSSEKLDSAHLALYYSKLWVKSNYTCDISFEGTNTIHIVQRAVIWAEVLVDSSGTDGNIADYTLEETYSLSVDQAGNLQLVPESSKQTNNSVDPSVNGFINYFTSINEVFDKLENTFSGFAADELQQVFTFHQPRFSNYGDLLCDITYVKPSTQAAPARKVLMSSQNVSHQLSASCELMQNYMAGSLVLPTGKFTALQTKAGLSLVFAFDTAGALYIFEEQSSIIYTGYLMMAATVNGTDQLFVSLLNSSSDPSWTSSPIWSPIPFDAESLLSDNTADTLTITGMLFAEVFGKKQYIIVDTERVSGDAATKNITYYVVHPTAEEGSRWVKVDIPVDVEETAYQSCVGRVYGERIDRVYTSGQAGESSQLVYVPLENVYGNRPPEPTCLSLPTDMHLIAIAVARDANLKSDQFGGTELKSSTAGSIWQPQHITLAATVPTEPALSFNSYTTTMQVAGTNKMPTREVFLAISAEISTPAYINGLYYVLSDTLVIVKTDAMGTVMVIKAMEDLHGISLTMKKLLQEVYLSNVQATIVTIDQLDTTWSSIQDRNIRALVKNRGVIPVTYYQECPGNNDRDLFNWIEAWYFVAHITSEIDSAKALRRLASSIFMDSILSSIQIRTVAYTVIYKVINNKPSFPDNNNSAALIAASSWDELEQLFSSTVTSPRVLSQTTQQSIYVSANAMSGMVLLIGNIALFMEAQAPTAGNTLSGLVAVIKLIVVASVGASNLLAPKDPIQDSGMKVLSRVCFGLDIATSFLGFIPIYGKLAATTSKFPNLLLSDGRAVGAVFKALLLIPKLMAMSYHLYELTSEEAGAARSAAIVGEVVNLTGAVVTVSYAAAVNDKELASRQVPIEVMTLCVDLWSGLLVAESMIH